MAEAQLPEILLQAGMSDFQSIWDMDLQLVDQPNTRKSGWSEVAYLPLQSNECAGIYIKRQQDYGFFNLRNPFRPVQTFEREFNNIQQLSTQGIPVVEAVYYESRRQNGHQQTILITKALDDYFSLSDEVTVAQLTLLQRRHVIRQVARVIRNLHNQNMQHGCLYPKHIYVHRSVLEGSKDVDIRLIDLEKAERFNWWNGGSLRDLDSLNRRAYGWSTHDRLAFLEAYSLFKSERTALLSYF